MGEVPPGRFWELATLGAPCGRLREVEAGCACVVHRSVGFRVAGACLALCVGGCTKKESRQASDSEDSKQAAHVHKIVNKDLDI